MAASAPIRCYPRVPLRPLESEVIEDRCAGCTHRLKGPGIQLHLQSGNRQVPRNRAPHGPVHSVSAGLKEDRVARGVMPYAPVLVLCDVVGNAGGVLYAAHHVLEIHLAGRSGNAVPVITIDSDRENGIGRAAGRYLRHLDAGARTSEVISRHGDVPVVRPNGGVGYWRDLKPTIPFEDGAPPGCKRRGQG